MALLSSAFYRLNTLERASIYEQTFSESWLDELDGECDDPLDITDSALGADGATGKGRRAAERKEMTESEIGVSDGLGLQLNYSISEHSA